MADNEGDSAIEKIDDTSQLSNKLEEKSAEEDLKNINGESISDDKNQESKNASNDEKNAQEKDLPRLFVGRLPPNTKENQLKELFSTYGEVVHCDIVGKYGFVHMKVREEADEAMKKLNNHNFNGSNLSVQLSTSTSKKSKRTRNKRGNFTRNNGNMRHTNNGNNSRRSGNRFSKNNNINNDNRMRNTHKRYDRSMNNLQSRPPHMPPLQNQGYFPSNQMMNSYYQSPALAVPQSQIGAPGGPPPLDIYYNRPLDNGYYRGNGPSLPPPAPMYQTSSNAPNYSYNRGVASATNKQPFNPQMGSQGMWNNSPMSMAPMNANSHLISSGGGGVGTYAGQTGNYGLNNNKYGGYY